jgi:F-type H+-transporting ATPase subunit epsilon
VPLSLDILTPNRVLLQDEQIDELNLPGADGYLGILPGHIALLTTLGQGELMYRQGERRRYLTIFGGYMEVKDDKVVVLAEIAENMAEIDRARAEAALERAFERLRTRNAEEVDFDRALAAMSRARIRLQVARRTS